MRGEMTKAEYIGVELRVRPLLIQPQDIFAYIPHILRIFTWLPLRPSQGSWPCVNISHRVTPNIHVSVAWENVLVFRLSGAHLNERTTNFNMDSTVNLLLSLTMLTLKAGFAHHCCQVFGHGGKFGLCTLIKEYGLDLLPLKSVMRLLLS